MGCVWAFVIVELDPLGDASPGFGAGFPSMQIDAFVFQRSPKPFHEDVVKEPSFSIH